MISIVGGNAHPLVFDVFLDYLGRYISSRAAIITSRPQMPAPECLFDFGVHLKQRPCWTTLQYLGNLGRGIERWRGDEKVNVIWHHFNRMDIPFVSVTNFLQDWFHVICESQDWLSILWDPDKVIIDIAYRTIVGGKVGHHDTIWWQTFKF